MGTENTMDLAAAMHTRMRAFDPEGTIAEAVPLVWNLLGEQVCDGAESFMDYLFRGASEAGRSLVDKQKVVEQTRQLLRQKFSHFDIAAWAEGTAFGVRECRKSGISYQHLVVALTHVSEAISDMVYTLTVDDMDVRRKIMRALRLMNVVEVDLIFSVISYDTAQEEREARHHNGELFQEQIAGEIDDASVRGETLRVQAKAASGATRGMLDKVSEVAAAAEQSALAMREAAHISATLIRAIEDTRAEVECTADVAVRASSQAGEAVTMSVTLSDHAQAIESILGLIRDIAGQTNLLALNATIEAARAGDAGRGFAVVAQEVKSLANQTARATDDIAQKIAAIQTSTRLSVETNQRIQETVSEVQASADRIRSAMDAQAQTVTMITAAVDETALAADSMSGTVATIRQDTEIVASEIDNLEQGFGQVEGKLHSLRDAAAEFSRRVA